MRFEFKNNLPSVVTMILSFMYGGVSLFFFVALLVNVGTIPTIGPQFGGVVKIVNGSPSEMGVVMPNQTDLIIEPRGIFRVPDKIESHARDLVYLLISISLIGSIISILAGISILSMLRNHERKKITKGMLDTLTTPEEKLAIEELGRANGELTQSDLVKNTGLSKVRIHRVVKRLEELGIIKKYPYGMTNKLKLDMKKELD
jgi:uncharacterized membrane protein